MPRSADRPRVSLSRRFWLALAAVLLLGVPSRSQTPAADAGYWVGTWAAAPVALKNASGTLADATTLREIVHTSRGGSRARVTLTNELGTDSLTISAAHLALRGEGSGILPGSDHPLTFSGQSSVTIPPGAVAVSDPISVKLPATGDAVVSLSLPAQQLHTITAHALALETNYATPGDESGAVNLPAATPLKQWRFLKSIEVSSEAGDGSIVTLGDSITDGTHSTPDTDRRWPDVLARRLQTSEAYRGLGVLNEGIGGNRILHDGAGPNALARFDRDVLSQAGVRYLIILEGINDIGRTTAPHTPEDAVTAGQVIGGLTQLIERAHTHGIKVYGATLTPFVGAGYSSPAAEVMRQAVNTWIRTSGRFDAVIDFDKVIRDSAVPDHFAAAFDSGDHLHPNDAGYKAMGESIDLTLFSR